MVSARRDDLSEVCTVSNGIGVVGAPDKLLVHDRGRDAHALSTYQ